MYKKALIIILCFWEAVCHAQTTPTSFKNPIITGFSPDPSICRVGNDYYLVNSSFVWYPAIPIYRSKDLVNWELIGHGITKSSQLHLNGVKDDDGIWAVTIRYHNGLFYLIGTANKAGGNFLMTAKDPAGEWSDPIWLKDAPGIDASLFWDDDGKCYYIGNRFDQPKAWPAQVAIWAQELNLNQMKLVGERQILTYGHANNARYAEGPHIYKVDGKYLLLCAEGGSSYFHAVTAHHNNKVLGPYIADKINPVLSHRQLGMEYPIQEVGHSDLVQTQNGDWWAVALGKRIGYGKVSLSRETFLCKVQFENGTPIFNPGEGKVLKQQSRPNLPWTPVKSDPVTDEFDTGHLSLKWHFIRVPQIPFYSLEDGRLKLKLSPVVPDSLLCPSMIVQKLKETNFESTTKFSFKTKKDNEQAGLAIYRNNGAYFLLLKGRNTITLISKDKGKKKIVAQVPYSRSDVYLRASGNGEQIIFSYGSDSGELTTIGAPQDIRIIAEGGTNRFNGPGIGMYAGSNGKPSKNSALFDWFDYQDSQ